MIIMSVDFGDSRTGIAVCGKSELIASPVTVIQEKDFEKCIEKHNRVLVMMIIFVKLKMEKFLEKHEYMNVIIFQRNSLSIL